MTAASAMAAAIASIARVAPAVAQRTANVVAAAQTVVQSFLSVAKISATTAANTTQSAIQTVSSSNYSSWSAPVQQAVNQMAQQVATTANQTADSIQNNSVAAQTALAASKQIATVTQNATQALLDTYKQLPIVATEPDHATRNVLTTDLARAAIANSEVIIGSSQLQITTPSNVIFTKYEEENPKWITEMAGTSIPTDAFDLLLLLQGAALAGKGAKFALVAGEKLSLSGVADFLASNAYKTQKGSISSSIPSLISGGFKAFSDDIIKLSAKVNPLNWGEAKLIYDPAIQAMTKASANPILKPMVMDTLIKLALVSAVVSPIVYSLNTTDIICWGFGYCDSKVRERYNTITGKINTNFTQLSINITDIQQAQNRLVESGTYDSTTFFPNAQYTMAKELIPITNDLISELDYVLSSTQATTTAKFGVKYDDLKRISDIYRQQLDVYKKSIAQIELAATQSNPTALLPDLNKFQQEEIARNSPFTFTGIVDNIRDGDTFDMANDPGNRGVRLSTGIDTRETWTGSEISKYSGRVSKARLSELILNKEVSVSVLPEKIIDDYGRFLGEVKQGTTIVNLEIKNTMPTTLHIVSDPSRAEVYLSGKGEWGTEAIDNMLVGLSGTTIKNIPPGRYVATLRYAGFEDYIIHQTIVSKTNVPIDISGTFVLVDKMPPTLKELTDGSFSISSDPSRAEILLSGTSFDKNQVYSGDSVGVTGTTIDGIYPGVYSAVLRYPGYYDYSVPNPIAIYHKEKTNVPSTFVLVPLEKEKPDSSPPDDKTIEELNVARLSVASRPEGAKVFLNGIYTGKSTPALFDLAMGDWSLILEKSGFESIEKRLSITNTLDVPLVVDLVEIVEPKLPVVFVNSYPEKANIFIDGLPTNRKTPMFFEIAGGTHIFRVELAGYVPAEKSQYISEVV